MGSMAALHWLFVLLIIGIPVGMGIFGAVHYRKARR